MIEMYLLEQLAAVEAHGTLSEASRNLHITQPALTRSMKKLERQLGYPLFIHERNRIIINDTGKLAADYARRILTMEQEMIASLDRFERSRHTISLASCAPAPLAYLQRRLTSLYPEKTIISRLEGDEAQLVKELQNGTNQIIILSKPLELIGFTCRKLFTERLKLSVMPAHPAAELDSVSFHDLDGETFLVQRALGVWRQVVEKNMPHAHFIYQDSRQDMDTLLKSSSLPAFSTDIGNKLFGAWRKRKEVPIRDEAAALTFYAISAN